MLLIQFNNLKYNIMKPITKDQIEGIKKWIEYLTTEGKMHKEQGSEGFAYDYELSAQNLQTLLDSTQQVEENTKYILFGESVTKLYHELEFDELIKRIKEDDITDFDIYLHTPEKGIDNLLQAHDGWNGYALITKDEYEYLETHN